MSTAILEKLPIKIFADGADLEGIVDLYRKPFIKGLTTNSTLRDAAYDGGVTRRAATLPR